MEIQRKLIETEKIKIEKELMRLNKISAETGVLLDRRKENEKLLLKWGLGRPEMDYLKLAKENLSFKNLKYKLQSFNETFGKELDVREFKEIIEAIK